MDELSLREQDGAVCFEVRVAPRASRDGLGGVHDGALKLSLTAAPVDGAANAALIALLAKALGVPKRAVRIVRGEHARNKSVRVEGVSLAAVRVALGAAGTKPPAAEPAGRVAAPAAAKRRLPLGRAGESRLELPTIMDRALATQHGSGYVQLCAFAIDVDRSYVEAAQDAGLPFGWEVFLTECYLLSRIDAGDPAQRLLLEDTCLSILEQPADEQGYGSQLLFAVYDAIERGALPPPLRAMFAGWRSKPKQLRKALGALFAQPHAALAQCAGYCLRQALEPPLAPPARQVLLQMQAGEWPVAFSELNRKTGRREE